MPGEPVETGIGIAGIGFGVLMVYSAFRNIPLLGPNGIFAKTFAGGTATPTPSTGNADGGSQLFPDPNFSFAPSTPPFKEGFGPAARSGISPASPSAGPRSPMVPVVLPS